MTQQIFMRLHIVYELRLQRKLSTIARQTQWYARNTQRNNIWFLFGTATYTCTFLISDPITIIHWSSMTKCSLSEMYKILCGVLNYVHIYYIVIELAHSHLPVGSNSMHMQLAGWALMVWSNFKSGQLGKGPQHEADDITAQKEVTYPNTQTLCIK